MKTIVALAISIFVLAPVHAQVFSPQTVNGAVLGGIAGAVIGHNSGSLHHNAWQGAAIGSVAGALLGSTADAPRGRPVYRPYVVAYPRYYSHGYRGYSEPYRYSRPGYASSGLLLGGIAGGIIGNNSHGHNSWQGAAIGAGAGLLLGAIADQNVRDREAREEVQVASVAPVVTQSAPQNVTIINNYYGGATATPMSSANTMFGR